MRIQHIIIGVKNLLASEKFYCDLLGFTFLEDFVDSKTGASGKILRVNDNDVPLDILLVPFEPSRHPNPQHMAFEVSLSVFNFIYNKAKVMGLQTRVNPSLTDKTDGFGGLCCGGKEYKNFYILDPNGINIELMHLV